MFVSHGAEVGIQAVHSRVPLLVGAREKKEDVATEEEGTAER